MITVLGDVREDDVKTPNEKGGAKSTLAEMKITDMDRKRSSAERSLTSSPQRHSPSLRVNFRTH